MLLLIQLRWIAVVGQIVTIVFVERVLGISLPLVPMMIVVAALVVLNIASLVWLRNGREVGDPGLLVALLLDVAALTAQLYLSGGATNPFTFLYLLQVTLAAVLLDTRSTWAVVAATCVAFVASHRILPAACIAARTAAICSSCTSSACSSASRSTRLCWSSS